jgi:hypothetical protein
MEMLNYRRFALMMVLSFFALYVLTYAMVYSFGYAVPNLNQFYMAGLMTAALMIIEITVMHAIYENKTANRAILAIGLVALFGCWLLIRNQVGISEKQFMKSMIPHHASAILMCDRASLKDAEIKDLCYGIVARQLSEIQEMEARLPALHDSTPRPR